MQVDALQDVGKFVKVTAAKVHDSIFLFLKQENNLDQMIDYKILLEKVEIIIDSLPNRRKEVFIKRKYGGLSVRQIAEELGISPNTVENQLASAQKQIQ
jgi:RNA polymerase sigma-70 factor (ECF subfamily)